MWKKVFKHVHEGFAVEVSKDFRQRKAVYSAKFGVIRNEDVLPFVDLDKFTTPIMAELISAGVAFLAEDRKKDADDEQKRIDSLAGKGNNRNQTAGTGLSRFKKKKEVNATG